MNGVTLRSLPRRLLWALGHSRALLPRSHHASNTLLLISAALLLGSLWLFDRTRDVRAAGDAAPAREVAVHNSAAVMTSANAKRLEEFGAHLPAHEEVPAVLRELIERAAVQGVALSRGSYQTVSDPSGAFTRFRMIHPVSGGASDVHRFLMESLRTHRALALESVQFKRLDGRSATVEARIQWTLFTRPIGAATKEAAR